MPNMYYFGQEQWNWLIAVYLFLGGMGAMVMAIGTWVHRYRAFGQDNTRLMVWANFTGFAMLAAGSLMLFYHLLDHLAVWHVFLGIFYKPDAWIAWGTWSIVLGMIWGVVDAIGHMETPRWLGWCRLWRFAHWFGQKFAGPLAWGTIFMSVFTAFYTGMLMMSYPAVDLWHNTGIPVLFTVSAISTALAALLILQYVFVRDNDHALRHAFEKWDTWMIGIELLVVLALMIYLAYNAHENARVSFDILWNSPWWVYGFIGLGLIAPFLLNLAALKKWVPEGAAVVLSSATLVLLGGYLLRHFILLAGVYELPYTQFFATH